MKLGQRMTEASEVVQDANVLVRLVAPSDYEEQTEALWNSVATGNELCVVPSFCPTEVISSLRQMGRGGLLTPRDEEEAVERFTSQIQPVLITIDSPALTRLAWEIARDLKSGTSMTASTWPSPAPSGRSSGRPTSDCCVSSPAASPKHASSAIVPSYLPGRE
jgi:predicted nucleic acid-binding protein